MKNRLISHFSSLFLYRLFTNMQFWPMFRHFSHFTFNQIEWFACHCYWHINRPKNVMRLHSTTKIHVKHNQMCTVCMINCYWMGTKTDFRYILLLPLNVQWQNINQWQRKSWFSWLRLYTPILIDITRKLFYKWTHQNRELLFRERESKWLSSNWTRK